MKEEKIPINPCSTALTYYDFFKLGKGYENPKGCNSLSGQQATNQCA